MTTQHQKQGYVYIMTNPRNNVLYTGVTNDLKKRTHEHKEKLVEGFSKTYNINKLVYYEASDSIENAIVREKQIKGGSRKRKLRLIQTANPTFKDLYSEI